MKATMTYEATKKNRSRLPTKRISRRSSSACSMRTNCLMRERMRDSPPMRMLAQLESTSHRQILASHLISSSSRPNILCPMQSSHGSPILSCRDCSMMRLLSRISPRLSSTLTISFSKSLLLRKISKSHFLRSDQQSLRFHSNGLTYSRTPVCTSIR